jgi:hypothetical protein
VIFTLPTSSSLAINEKTRASPFIVKYSSSISRHSTMSARCRAGRDIPDDFLGESWLDTDMPIKKPR